MGKLADLQFFDSVIKIKNTDHVDKVMQFMLYREV